MKIPERKRRNSALRKDNYITVLIIAFIGALIFRIPLGNIIGEKGLAYFGTANELCILLAGIIGYGLMEATAVLVRYRIKRDQMKSAQKIVSTALLLSMLLGILIGLVTAVTAYIFAEKVLCIPLAGLAIAMMTPAIVFQMMSGVLKGYFKGNGSRVPAMHSMMMQVVFLFVGGLAGAKIMGGYGEKVSALLQNADYASAYGAAGAALGMVVASILCFLHLLILFMMLSGKQKRQMGRELQRNVETTPQITGMLFGTGILYIGFYLVFFSHASLDQYLLFRFGDIAQGADTVWGNYYGKYQVVLGIIAGICILMCLAPVKRIVSLLEHEEYRGARERFGVLIHQCMVVAAPTAILLAVLSENILDALFGGNNTGMVQWLQFGGISLFAMIFGVTFLDMLLKMRRLKTVVGIGAIGLLVHIVSAIVLMSGMKAGVLSLIVSQLLFWLIIAVPGFMMISRMVQYKQEWIRSFAFPIVAAAIAGLLAMLLNKALLSLLGNIATLIICVFFGAISYFVILFALKDFSEEELEIMSGGNILLTIGKMLRLM